MALNPALTRPERVVSLGLGIACGVAAWTTWDSSWRLAVAIGFAGVGFVVGGIGGT